MFKRNTRVKKDSVSAAAQLSKSNCVLGAGSLHLHTLVFAHCSLVATALAQLYSEDWHTEFREKFLGKVIEKRPESIRNAAVAILHGGGDYPMLPFAEALMTEESVRACPEMVLHDLLLVALHEGCYDARSRYLLKHIASILNISWASLEDWELRTAVLNFDPASEIHAEAREHEKRHRKVRCFTMIGSLLCILGVSIVVGILTGGAVLVIPIPTVNVRPAVNVLGSVFGVAGAGLTGWKMRKRVGSLTQFQFLPLTPPPAPQLHLCIAVSGWIDQGDLDFLMPWQSLALGSEQYALCWESQYLQEMGKALDYFMSYLKGFAIQETLKLTVLSGLLAAIAWPAAVLSASNVIDNPWSVCGNRAVEGGKVLADVLLGREYGQRPVTLIGFSMGAKLIFSCLQELASRKKGVEGIIEDVYLLGAPVSGSAKDWEPFSRVVSGKIVNCYCRTDWFLKFMYRTMSASFSLAGLGPVKWSDRRMCNLDLTSLISGHKDYFKRMSEILPIIGVRTNDQPRSTFGRYPGLSAPQLAPAAPASPAASAAAAPGAAPIRRSASLSRLDDIRRASVTPVPGPSVASPAEVASSNPATRGARPGDA